MQSNEGFSELFEEHKSGLNTDFIEPSFLTQIHFIISFHLFPLFSFLSFHPFPTHCSGSKALLGQTCLYFLYYTLPFFLPSFQRSCQSIRCPPPPFFLPCCVIAAREARAGSVRYLAKVPEYNVQYFVIFFWMPCPFRKGEKNDSTRLKCAYGGGGKRNEFCPWILDGNV